MCQVGVIGIYVKWAATRPVDGDKLAVSPKSLADSGQTRRVDSLGRGIGVSHFDSTDGLIRSALVISILRYTSTMTVNSIRWTMIGALARRCGDQSCERICYVRASN